MRFGALARLQHASKAAARVPARQPLRNVVQDEATGFQIVVTCAGCWARGGAASLQQGRGGCRASISVRVASPWSVAAIAMYRPRPPVPPAVHGQRPGRAQAVVHAHGLQSVGAVSLQSVGAVSGQLEHHRVQA